MGSGDKRHCAGSIPAPTTTARRQQTITNQTKRTMDYTTPVSGVVLIKKFFRASNKEILDLGAEDREELGRLIAESEGLSRNEDGKYE